MSALLDFSLRQFNATSNGSFKINPPVMKQDQLVLGYWDIRGLAQPIRLLLEYTGERYAEKRYACGEAPGYDRTCWLSEKEHIGLPFPNLPYLLDGDLKLTQSMTIMRHIARKHGLLGTTPQEMAVVDNVADEICDFRGGLSSLCYGGDFDQKLVGYLTRAAERLGRLEKFMEGRTWVAGDNLSLADFVLYEALDQHRLLKEELLAPCERLRAFVDRFAALPAIAQYLKSERCIVRPVNNKMAAWK